MPRGDPTSDDDGLLVVLLLLLRCGRGLSRGVRLGEGEFGPKVVLVRIESEKGLSRVEWGERLSTKAVGVIIGRAVESRRELVLGGHEAGEGDVEQHSEAVWDEGAWVAVGSGEVGIRVEDRVHCQNMSQ